MQLLLKLFSPSFSVWNTNSILFGWEIGWTKFQEVILPNLVFQLFIQQSINQLRKSHTMKPLVTYHSSGICLQSQNFVEFDILFSLRKGQLWTPISRLLLGFRWAYIYSFERFFSQLFNGVLKNFDTFLFIQLLIQMWKNVLKNTDFLTSLDRH